MEYTYSKRTHQRGVVTLALVLFMFRVTGSIPVNSEIETRNTVVCIAQSQLHVRETTGNNDGPDVKQYLNVTGLPEGYPWCAAFVSWVFQEAGISAPKSARVVDWFDNRVIYQRSWQKTSVPPQKGMLIGLYYPKLGRYGHIALVEKENPGIVPRNCCVISGNSNQAGSREGDGVYRKIYSWKLVAVMADYCITEQEFKTKYLESKNN